MLYIYNSLELKDYIILLLTVVTFPIFYSPEDYLILLVKLILALNIKF